ncbi:putative tyrosinase-like protein tyr-1 isoform X3 [Octopus sinensis]|uniref:Tyrosinase-like protein tyr-1 isoform X3 n=1 Tax=Octopus sinensis TaxID=2607531 RepID=A0A7E6ENM2_9MOLL|nr:putative tyrosinase-like protein tyr-1 isoform X3 [Octopus sinensis]
MNRLYFAFVILLSFVYVSSYIQEDIEKCYRQLGTNDADTQLQFCIGQVQMNCSSFKWSPKNVVYKSPKQSGANNLIIPRTRKEYRLLSNQERYDFLRSLYLLKQDTRLSPNVFDSIAFLHTGDTARNAHAGPTFLLWHRIYLRMMEDALREKVPGVTIPFWDPTLDSHLSNPRDSTMWSDELMGTINGFVTKGAFANWKTPAGTLIRNGGFITRLPTSSNIEDVLTRTKLEEISEPNAQERYNLEFLHNSMHVVIGGHMGSVPSSPMDPIFWLVHSYIELVNARFNENQRRHNVNPATDYPSDYGLNVYAPNQSIGLMNLTVLEALRETESYTNIYKYDYSYLGNCALNPNLCNSPYLTCNNGRCESKSKNSTRCSTLIPYQNMFCINRRCDVDEWAFIPVEIIYERPFDTMKFGNFPIKNGLPNLLNDLYDDNQPLNSSSGNSTGNNCQNSKCCGPAGRLNVQASGINYFGTYQEMVVLDRRLAVSSDITYIGIRNPERNASVVFITASEQCGRICRPSCLVPGSNPPRYTPCIGLLNVTRNNATMYGKTLAEAYMKVWDYRNQIRPKLRHENIPIVFHCDDSRWPFNNNTNTTTTASPSTRATTTTATTTTTTTTTTTLYTTASTTTRVYWPIRPSPKKCYINQNCAIAKGCDCISMDKQPCIQKCSHYALCVYGSYIVSSCGYGRRYEPYLRRCIPGRCQH